MPKIHSEVSAITRLIIVDDNESLRKSMRSMLQTEPDLQVIAEAKDGQEAIELCRLHRPDLVLMDIRMPKMNGLEATQVIKEELPATKILIMSAEHIGVSEFVRRSADGYITKDASLEKILQTIREVLIAGN